MNEFSHYVPGYQTAARQVDPALLPIIDGEVARYRRRLQKINATKPAAEMLTTIFERYLADENIGSREANLLLIGLLNSLCEHRLVLGLERATCQQLERWCPSIAGHIDRIYGMLDPELNVPGTICGFTPIRVLGTGGHGQVMAVKDEFGQSFAIKFALVDSLEADLIAHEGEIVNHLMREGPEMHRFMPRYTHLVPDNRHVGLLMEHLRGINLKARLDGGLLRWREVREVALPLLDALQSIHAAAIIHLDLKPANVFLRKAETEFGNPVLIDFGLAMKLNQGNQPARESSGLGDTPDFAAPEQRRQENVGIFTDIYQIGGLLGFALTGITPAQGDVLLKRLDQIATDIRAARPMIRAIKIALAEEPAERFATAEQFRDSLWWQQSKTWKQRKKWLRAASAAVVIILLSYWAIGTTTGRKGPATWVDDKQRETGITLADVRKEQITFATDFVEGERANYYRTGFLFASIDPKLQPFAHAIEFRIGDGPWKQPLLHDDFILTESINSKQIIDGQTVAVRFDSLPGPGVGTVYGEPLEYKFDFATMRDSELADWQDIRKGFAKNAIDYGHAFKYENGWTATTELLNFKEEIEDIVLFEGTTPDTISTSLRSRALNSIVEQSGRSIGEDVFTMLEHLPEAYRFADRLNFAIVFRGQPSYGTGRFWDTVHVVTLYREDRAYEKIMKGKKEFVLPKNQEERNQIASSMIAGESPDTWTWTDTFVDEHSPVVAAITLITRIQGDPETAYIVLGQPSDNPSVPSRWTHQKRIGHLLDRTYDVTCFFGRVIFLDGTSSDYIRFRLKFDTPYRWGREKFAVPFDAPELISKDQDISKVLRSLVTKK